MGLFKPPPSRTPIEILIAFLTKCIVFMGEDWSSKAGALHLKLNARIQTRHIFVVTIKSPFFN